MVILNLTLISILLLSYVYGIDDFSKEFNKKGFPIDIDKEYNKIFYNWKKTLSMMT